jgi:hypothetical protein
MGVRILDGRNDSIQGERAELRVAWVERGQLVHGNIPILGPAGISTGDRSGRGAGLITGIVAGDQFPSVGP